MFAANGWTVIDAKYGKKLQAAFHEPNGELLRAAIDDMSNDMYQRLLRVDAPVVREWMPRVSRYPDDLRRLLSRWDDAQLEDLLTNLGGHDFAELRRRLRPRRPGGRAQRTVRLHAQGLEAAVHRRPQEPRRHDEQGPDGDASRRPGNRPRTTSRRRLDPWSTAGQGRQRGRGAPAGRRRAAPERPGSRHTRRLRPRLPRRDVVAADIRPRAHRHRPEHPRRIRARRDRQPRCRQLHQPGRLDQQGRGLVARRARGAAGA